eukprot:3199215-Rhodomonas_salina.1
MEGGVCGEGGRGRQVALQSAYAMAGTDIEYAAMSWAGLCLDSVERDRSTGAQLHQRKIACTRALVVVAR